MKPMKFFLTVIFIFSLLSNISHANISDILTFSAADFDTSIIEAPDSNYYVRVSCDLTQQASVDSVGAPDLLAVIYNYSLPQGEQIDSVSITNRDTTLLAGLSHLVYPKQEEIPLSLDIITSAFEAPGAWYDSSYYPPEEELATVARPFSFSFGMSMGSIQIRPVYYNIDSSELWLITSLSVTLHTSSSGQSPRSCTNRSTFAQNRIVKSLKGMVENSGSVDGNMPSIQTYSYNYPTDPDDIPPEYIIITASRFAFEIGFFEHYKYIKGTPVEIVTVEYIAANYSGVDLPEKIRNCIIDKYGEGANYVILMGNWEDMPMRYAAPTNYSSPPDDGVLVPTDLYYACLEGSWDDGDNDGIYGEPVDVADIGADIWVGRVAISDTGHASTWVEKYINFIEASGNGDSGYLTTALMATADQGVELGVHSYIAGHFPSWFTVDIETLEEQPSGGADPCTGPTGGDVIDELSDPTCQFFYSNCHGSPCFYAVCTHGYNEGDQLCVTTDPWRFNNYSNWGYIPDVVNEGREYIHCSISCGLGQLDSEQLNPDPPEQGGYGPCMAEDELITEGGAFAGTYNSRVGWWDISPDLEATRIDWLLGSNGEQYEHRFGPVHYAIRSSIPDSYRGRQVLYGNNLFGDSEFQVYYSSSVRHFAIEMPTDVQIHAVDTVTIRVKDSQTQTGIPNVFVTLSKDGEIYERGITNITGRYYPVLHPTSFGDIEIACSKAGYTLSVDSIEVVPYCADAVAGDVNGNGYVQGSDITYATNYFRGGPPPPDSCMCPVNFLYHAADANGNCAFTGSDITFLINYFRGGQAPYFCQFCPTGTLLLSKQKIIPVEKTKTDSNLK